MAYLNAVQAQRSTALSKVALCLRNLRQAWDQYRVYRKTVDELSTLSGRELADLGLNRSLIKRAALDAAYGAN